MQSAWRSRTQTLPADEAGGARLPTNRPMTEVSSPATDSLRRARPGAAVIALGLVLLVLMLAFPERLRVPASIGYVAAATFVLAGLLALANEFCGRATRAWLAVALVSCMVVPSAWIAFGPGPRTCSFAWGHLAGAMGGGMCRGAFGIAAILGLVLVLLALRSALKAVHDEH